MSDREIGIPRESPTGSVSDHSITEKKVIYRSLSRDHSPVRSRSRTPSRKSRSKKGYSHSRSRSRSRSRKSHRTSSRYRSRSRSSRRYKSRYSYSRSRSGSSNRDGFRSHSRSPMSNRRRHLGNRDNPLPGRCLGVFGLNNYTTEQQLHHIFSKYGPVEKVQVVIDAKTGRSRGFCFVYFENHEDAKAAKDQCSGMEIDGRRIRVDYSITLRAHTPTPGIYMGKPTYIDDRNWRSGRNNNYDDYYGDGGGRGGGGYRYKSSYRRSPSPYYKRHRYVRSRSRSYSPRIEEIR
ncbi:transformer-2 protein homolog beta-like isoform X2 [Lycorma delicatula]|uniref:transformer-2 protein homolog beta-like isoform X2 n=1 Tax=Lycorma delicatula TaxID=130591 RepID=UPI003F51602B